MFARFVPVAVLAAGLLFAAGCGPAKLNVSKTWDDFDSADAKGIELPAQPKPQTINVEFSSSNCDVTVYVFKKDDIKVEDDMSTAPGSKALAKKTGKAESLTAEVPANTATWVVVRDASKKTKVDVKVTNKS